ncbi:MAG: dienelactone hydrolase family protein [Pseudomonadota bacterium]
MTRVDARLARSGAPATRATAGLVLVHGRGGSAADILGLGEALGLPDLTLIAPEAPGRSWWPTSFLAPMAEMENPLIKGLEALESAISTLEAEGLSRNRIAVAGFSQGACLALEYAARAGAGLHSVYGLSGGLVGTADKGDPSPALYGFSDKALDYNSALNGLPVYVSVHAQDPHIPLRRAEDSIAAFQRIGASTRLEVAPGPGHGLLQADVEALRGGLNSSDG